MKTQKLILLTVLGTILVFSLSCVITPAPQPTYTPYPTYTPPPTYTPLPPIDTPIPTPTPYLAKKTPSANAPAVNSATIIRVLLENGFMRESSGDSYCNTPCKGYIYKSGTALIAAQVYDSGSFGIAFVWGDNVSSGIVNKVFGELYPPELCQWIKDHMTAVVSADQSQVIDDKYVVAMVYSKGMIGIIISPL